MHFTENDTVWLSGATGFWGHEFCRQLLETNVGKLIAYCRSEHRAATLAEQFPDDRMRIHLGDIRDPERLTQSLYGSTYVIHAAALKRIETGSYNPAEIVKTNITGTRNIIEAILSNARHAKKSPVQAALFISSDKAYEPTTHYGITKAAAENCWLGANVYSPAPQPPHFRVIRAGNVLGSTGSVIHIWRKQLAQSKPLTITDPAMTRFHLTVREAVAFALQQLTTDTPCPTVTWPDMRAYTLHALAVALAGVGYTHHIITGARGYGEKQHEAIAPGICSATAERLTVHELRTILAEEGLLP